MLLLPVQHIVEHLDSIGGQVKKYIYQQPRLYSPANLLLILNILKQLSVFKPDVIHIQGGHPWLSLALPCLRLRGYHIVTTLHDIRPHPGENYLRTRLILFMARKFSNQVIVHGQKIKALLEESYPASRINVIPIGIL